MKYELKVPNGKGPTISHPKDAILPSFFPSKTIVLFPAVKFTL